jgi:hypothetical protein
MGTTKGDEIRLTVAQNAISYTYQPLRTENGERVDTSNVDE